MNECTGCKYKAGTNLCSLGYKQPIQEECPDFQEIQRESQDPVQDAMNNLEVYGTKEFHKLPRVVRGFYPNKYLISCWNGVAIFKVPSNEDHKARITRKGKDLSRERPLQIIYGQGEQGQDLLLVTQWDQSTPTDPLIEITETFRLPPTP